jgi:tetratricopeptide (TPR) repeat protein
VIPLYEQAIPIFERLVKEHPDKPAYLKDLAMNHSDLGQQLCDSFQQYPDAETSLQNAISLQVRLCRQWAGVPDYVHDLTNSYNRLGVLYLLCGRCDDAEATLKVSLPIAQILCNESPDNQDYQRRLIACVDNLARVYARTNRLAEAEAAFKKAIDLLERLVRDHPENPDHQRFLAGNLARLGEFYLRSGRMSEAGRPFQKAVTLMERLVHDHPQVPIYRRWLANAYLDLATCLSMHPDSKLRNSARSLELVKQSIELIPKKDEYWNFFIREGDNYDWFFLAMSHWQLGDKVQARKWYDQAVARMDKAKIPNDDELCRFRAEAAALLGEPDPAPPPKLVEETSASPVPHGGNARRP